MKFIGVWTYIRKYYKARKGPQSISVVADEPSFE